MKTVLLSLLLSLCTLATVAQVISDTTAQNNQPFYIGINGLAIGYDLEYKNEPKGGNIQPYASVYFGYNISKRLRIQAGVWYGNDNRDFGSIYVESADKLIYYNDISKTKGVGIPISADLVLFKPFKKLQFYGTAMLTPMYSTTLAEKSETRDDVKTITYREKISGINTYLTGGFGVAYPVSKRFNTYFNYYFISRNFNRGLRPRDEYPYPGSLALGLNYNFNLKRDK